MIATLDEFRQAKAILLEEKAKLVEAGTTVSDSIEVGMMVEIPASAVLADQFAKEVDFFYRNKRLNSIHNGCRPYERTSILLIPTI